MSGLGSEVASINQKELSSLQSKSGSFTTLSEKQNETRVKQVKALQDAAKEAERIEKELNRAERNEAASKQRAADNEKRKGEAESRLQQIRERLQTARANAQGPSQEETDKLYGDVYTTLRISLAAVKHAISIPEADQRHADLSAAFDLLDKWPQLEVSLEKDIAELSKCKPAADVTVVNNMWKELRDTTNKHSLALIRKQNDKKSYDERVDRLMKELNKMLQWCRQQRANLETLTQAEHIQEFVASFQNNIVQMESNFVVLMEMSEPLAPNTKVERSLMEITEVWLSLEVFAYERLRSTLLELHHSSKLEDAARAWSEFNASFKVFLQDTEKLLSMPSDEESMLVVKPALQTCQQLMADNDPHLLIVEHLADFSLREECMKDHYNAIRRTVFSKVTLLTQSFHGQQNYARKAEYQDRLTELNEWVDCKAQNDAWKELLARVDRVKQLIEDNETSHSTDENRY